MAKAKLTYRIDNIWGDLHHDSWKHGEGDLITCYGNEVMRGDGWSDKYGTLSELLGFINRELLYADEGNQWVYVPEDGSDEGQYRFETTLLVDTDGLPAGKREISSWKKGKTELRAQYWSVTVSASLEKVPTLREVEKAIASEGIKTY